MPTLFDRPTTAIVRTEINLRPEQVNHLYGGDGATAEQASAAYNADISRRLEIACEWVEQRVDAVLGNLSWPLTLAQIQELHPNWDSSRVTDWQYRVGKLLTEAATLRTAFLIYRKAGQLRPEYEAKAEAYQKMAEELLSGPEDAKDEGGLLDQIGAIVQAQDEAETQPVNAPRSRVLTLRMGW